MRVENAGDPLLEDDRVVRQPHQLIEDVAKSVRHLLVDYFELAPRQSADDVTLRQHDAAHRGDVALDGQDLARQLVGRRFDHRVFDLVEPLFELVHGRPVVIDHPIDDPVHQGDGALAHHQLVGKAQLTDLLDAPTLPVVHGDEKLPRSEKSRCRAVLNSSVADLKLMPWSTT